MDLGDIQAAQWDFSKRKFPGNMDLNHYFWALVGELGEFANKVKKIQRGDIEATPEVIHDLGRELADLQIYLVDMASCLPVILDDCYVEVAADNEGRWPDASSPDQSDLQSAVLQRQQGSYGVGSFVSQAEVLDLLQGGDGV